MAPNVPKGIPEDYARQVLPDYYGLVESLDMEFKRILDALDRAGVADDTWDYRATTGDCQLWLTGGRKQEGQDLGVPYPGRETLQPGKRKRKNSGE